MSMAKKDEQKHRKDVAELRERQHYLKDEHRKDAVEKRHRKGKRTARENIADLCDKDSFEEIGSLLIAAQRERKTVEELRRETPADGLICGIGKINAKEFKETSSCYILSYDLSLIHI